MTIKVAFLQYQIKEDSYKMRVGDNVIDLPYGESLNLDKWDAINNAKGANITKDQYTRIKAILSEES
jgi:hypothetical protein